VVSYRRRHTTYWRLSVQDRRKDVVSAKRERGFTAEEVAALYAQAQAHGDAPLADLIRLAAYTGGVGRNCALSRLRT
jgi:hypothetical protein